MASLRKGAAAPAAVCLVMAAMGQQREAQRPAPLVRPAELEIDPARLAESKAALREEIEQSIRLEPGVLALQAVSLKESPAQIRILEVYADAEAYQSHVKTPRLLSYKKATEQMVKPSRLLDAEPIVLGAKAR